jgi:ribonuclease HI
MIPKEKAWEKRYTVAFPTKKVDMLPSVNYDAYTDGSLMAGRSGADAYNLRNRAHFCSLRGNTIQATVFQTEVLAIKAAADMLLNNRINDNQVVFHYDNQAALKTVNSTDITKKFCRDAESLNKLGQLNEVCLEWVKAHNGIIGNEQQGSRRASQSWRVLHLNNRQRSLGKKCNQERAERGNARQEDSGMEVQV